jgi:hypothetical protein
MTKLQRLQRIRSVNFKNIIAATVFGSVIAELTEQLSFARIGFTP